MKLRYQFIEHPHTRLYETPQQAYLIVEGRSTFFQTKKISKSKTRTGRSTSCRLQCHKSKSCKKQRKTCGFCTDYGCSHHPVQQKSRGRLQSEHRCRQRSIPTQNFEYQDSATRPPTIRQSNPSAVSFRDINISQQKKLITCNYNKHLQQQNICLRKQNKFLQEYIQTLEYRSYGGGKLRKENDENRDRERKNRDRQRERGKERDREKQKEEKTDKTRASRTRYQSSRNSFMKRNVESSDKNSEDDNSTFAQRMLSSKGESEYNLYRG